MEIFGINIEYIFIYPINHILNIYNFIFFLFLLRFFFDKSEVVIVYKLN